MSWCKGGGEAKQPSEQLSLQHLAVIINVDGPVIIHIFRPNFSQKYDKLNKCSSKMYIKI